MNLVFNVNDLKDKVVPNIQRDSKYLNLSYDALVSISVPSDFQYRSRLISLPQKIKDIDSKNRQIEKWVNTAIGNLKSAEANNTNAMNRLSSSISKLNLGLNSKANNTGGKTTTTSKVTTSVKKTIGYAFLNKLILDASSLAKKTASKVVGKVKSKISWALSTGAKIVNKAKSKSAIVKKVVDTLEFIGGKITSAWKWMSEKVFTPLRNILKRTFASIANTVISFVKGLYEFIESLFDVVVMLFTGIASVFTGIGDGITYLASDNKEEWESFTSEMWKKTMGFVAEEHVENAYNAFFEESIVGQWLDENAFEAFSSDGVVCGVSSGLGYTAGIIILTVATAGAGTGAVAASTSTTVATQAAIATMSGIGKYTQESWAAKRDSSWEGIERMYQKGEISEEQFNSYVMIRELTDAEWSEIEQDYENGLISEEEYNAMKQIREMPNDWKTLENGLKGLAYGVANGVWEGVQWYVGGKLAGWTIKSGSQVASSAIRVGADTGFNALDTPFRTTVEALTSDKAWEEAWIDQGGLKTVLTDTIIGLIGSVGGEVVDLKKIKKANNFLNNNSSLFDGLDETTADKVRKALMDDYTSGKIDLNKMSQSEIEFAISNKINIFNTNIPAGTYPGKIDVDGAGKYLSNMDGNTIQNLYWYETSNGTMIKPFSSEYEDAIKSGIQLKKVGTNDYFQIKKILMNNYNMSAEDASGFIANAVFESKTNLGGINIDINNSNIKTTNELFERLSKGNGDYGVNQGVLKNLCYYKNPYTGELISAAQYQAYQQSYLQSGIQFKKVATKEYFEVKAAIMNRYNMSAMDASKIMSALDSVGACSYASAANDIVGHFKDSPEIFEQIFGFPLYKEAANGNLTINSAELLTDMYVTINHEANGGKIITTQNGKNVVQIRRDRNGFSSLDSGDMQQYMMHYDSLNENLYNRYIKSKTNQLEFETGLVNGYYSPNSYIDNNIMQAIKDEASKQMAEGNQISMYISKTNNPVNFIDMETGQVYCSTFDWNEGGAHAVYVTDVREDGFVVSTWGKQCLVLFSDLQDSGGFTTFCSRLVTTK